MFMVQTKPHILAAVREPIALHCTADNAVVLVNQDTDLTPSVILGMPSKSHNVLSVFVSFIDMIFGCLLSLSLCERSYTRVLDVSVKYTSGVNSRHHCLCKHDSLFGSVVFDLFSTIERSISSV